MEHDDRSTVATFFNNVVPDAQTVATLGESAAHHARVKRLEISDSVRIVDGVGRVGTGAIVALERGVLQVAMDLVQEIPRQSPLHLRFPIADRDRMLLLAEKATELGITTWQAVRFRRSNSVSPRGEGPGFAEKVRARMSAAIEQSGDAWLPEILPDVSEAELSFGPSELPILLDVGGEPLASTLTLPGRSSPVILFGPEGGLEAAERASLVKRGWQPARVAYSTLRFETAGIAAIAVCRNLHMLGE